MSQSIWKSLTLLRPFPSSSSAPETEQRPERLAQGGLSNACDQPFQQEPAAGARAIDRGAKMRMPVHQRHHQAPLPQLSLPGSAPGAPPSTEHTAGAPCTRSRVFAPVLLLPPHYTSSVLPCPPRLLSKTDFLFVWGTFSALPSHFLVSPNLPLRICLPAAERTYRWW